MPYPTFPFPPNNLYTRYFNTTEGLILQYWDKEAQGYRNASEFDINAPLAYILYVADPNYAPLFQGHSTDVGGYTLLSPGIGPGNPNDPVKNNTSNATGTNATASNSNTTAGIFDDIAKLLTPPTADPKKRTLLLLLIIILAAVVGYFFYKFLKNTK